MSKSLSKSLLNTIATKYATTVSNGTVALHLAMVALGIGLDDEIIVPTTTYIASVNTIATLLQHCICRFGK